MSTPDDDVRPLAPTSDAADAADAAADREEGDLDGLVTPAWAPSQSGAERAGTTQGLSDAEREAAAPGPTEVRVASDEYVDVPRLGGVTASDTQV